MCIQEKAQEEQEANTKLPSKEDEFEGVEHAKDNKTRGDDSCASKVDDQLHETCSIDLVGQTITNDDEKTNLC